MSTRNKPSLVPPMEVWYDPVAKMVIHDFQPDDMTLAQATTHRYGLCPPPAPLDEYHEDMGPVLWWLFDDDGRPSEPPHCGWDSDKQRVAAGHRYFTPLPLPPQLSPEQIETERKAGIRA